MGAGHQSKYWDLDLFSEDPNLDQISSDRISTLDGN